MVRSTSIRGARTSTSTSTSKGKALISAAIDASTPAPAPTPAPIQWEALTSASAEMLFRASREFASNKYMRSACALLRADSLNALAMTTGALNTALAQGQALVKCWGKALDVKLWGLTPVAGFVPQFRTVLSVLGLPVSDDIRQAEKQARAQVRATLFPSK